jgi:hypothetical protein
MPLQLPEDKTIGHENTHISSRPVGSDFSGSSSDAKKDSPANLPPSLLLLKGWFETGFLGYIPENAALFIWDQLILRGSRPESFQRLLPQVACALVVLLRNKFLDAKEWIDGDTLFRQWTQNIPTKKIVEALKGLQ